MVKKDSFEVKADNLPGMVAVYNINTGKYLYVNKAIKKLLGYAPEDFINGGLPFATSLVHPDDLQTILDRNTEALANINEKKDADTDPIVAFEYRMKHKKGNWIWLHTDGGVYSRDTNGNVECIINTSIDITERKNTELELKKAHKEIGQQKLIELKLKQSEKNFRNLVQTVEDHAIFALDLEGFITTWNEGVAKILGYSQEEFLGMHFSELFGAEERASGLPMQEMFIAKEKGDSVQEGLRKRKDGSTFHAIGTMTLIKDDEGSPKGFSKIMRDITEIKEAEETIRFQAYHDSLTGLSNRDALYEHFVRSQGTADRQNYKIAILFLDLDRFKIFNDTLGHETGDLILKDVADRLLRCVRKEDMVARLGGDEFIIMINEINGMTDVTAVVNKIMDALKPAMRINNQNLHITASIGIALFASDGKDLYSLLKNADVAMYKAKSEGKNRYHFYDHAMDVRSTERLSLEQDLRKALEEDEFTIAYQPFIDLFNGKPMGVEALVRWQHPRLGLLHPTEFIALAEETGMIVPLGKWVLEKVCQQAKHWYDSGNKLNVSINLSGIQLAEENLVDTIDKVLKDTGLPSGFLELEITESVAMENISQTSKKLQSLKEKGISLSIDDFGIGYSSLSYLKRFPVKKLKIDQSFIRHAIIDQQNLAIVKAIIAMGHSLGLKICAEGVEDKQTLDLLRSLKCDMAQGYYICKPLFAHELTRWLES